MFSTQCITDKVNAVTIHSMLHMTNVIKEAQHEQWLPARYLLHGTLFAARVLTGKTLSPICPTVGTPVGAGTPTPVEENPSAALVGTVKDGIGNVVKILMGIGVGVAVIGIIVGGLMRATSFGNERRIAMSNTAITCAVIGLVIVIVGVTAGNAIPGLFGITDYTGCQISS